MTAWYHRYGQVPNLLPTDCHTIPMNMEQNPKPVYSVLSNCASFCHLWSQPVPKIPDPLKLPDSQTPLNSNIPFPNQNQSEYMERGTVITNPKSYQISADRRTLGSSPMGGSLADLTTLYQAYHALLQSHLELNCSGEIFPSAVVSRSGAQASTDIDNATESISLWLLRQASTNKDRKAVHRMRGQYYLSSTDSFRLFHAGSKCTDRRDKITPYLSVKSNRRGRPVSQHSKQQSCKASAFGRIVPTARVLARMARIPNLIGPYLCRLCEQEFADPFKLAAHRCPCILHTDYRCPDCEKVFNCPANLASHRRWHKPKRNTLDLCSTQSSSSCASNPSRSTNFSLQSTFTCSACQNSCSTGTEGKRVCLCRNSGYRATSCLCGPSQTDYMAAHSCSGFRNGSKPGFSVESILGRAETRTVSAQRNTSDSYLPPPIITVGGIGCD